MKNVEGAGAAQAKTGKNRQVLDRSAGMSATSEALQSKTRSKSPASQKHNQYEGAPSGYGENENICGYGKGGCKG